MFSRTFLFWLEEKIEKFAVPLSVRGVSRMLCDTKFDVFATDFKGTKEDLKAKIGKVSVFYSCCCSMGIYCKVGYCGLSLRMFVCLTVYFETC